MDAADLVSSFLTGTYTVTRRTSGYDSHGRATTPSTTTASISACVQPAEGRDLLRLPEGRRSIETRVLFTTTQLLIASQAGSNSDLVTIDTRTWEVQHVESWRPDPLSPVPYFRCLVQVAS